MNVPATQQRLDYLDAVRASALLLGIVFHASLSFMPIFIGWAVMDISTSSVIPGFVLVSHSFRMELFFLIAGFFGHMTHHRNGFGGFIRSRFVRIAIPFVVGWFILKPLIIASWVMGSESMRGDVNILNGLKTGLEAFEQLPHGFLTGSHLWFLYYLLLITAATLAVRGVTSLMPRLYRVTTGSMDRLVAWIAQSRLSWMALSIPTGICLWGMRNWGMDTPDLSLMPHWPVFFVYGGFFALGWFLHRQQELMETFGRLTTGRVVLSVLSMGAAIGLSGYQADMGHPRLELFRAAFIFSYAIMMWSLVALSIGLFKRWFDRPSKAVRYIADSSYWLYLIHLPIVVWLQIAFAEVPMHWSIKLFAVSFLTIGISLVLYDLFVRSTVIGKILNGRKKERVLAKKSVSSNQVGARTLDPSLKGLR